MWGYCALLKEGIHKGHLEGIYTSAIVQPLRGIPLRAPLFAFTREYFNITEPNLKLANTFLLVSTSASSVTHPDQQEVKTLNGFCRGSSWKTSAGKPVGKSALQGVKMTHIWAMGMGLLVFGALTTKLWCGNIYFPPIHETRLFLVLHLTIGKRNQGPFHSTSAVACTIE